MTEVKATAGTDVPGDLVEDVMGEVMGFVSELKSFRKDIQDQIKKQDERMNMLDRKSLSRGRAPLSAQADTEQPHQNAFNAYLRHGDDDGLRGLVLEAKGMTTLSDGGFLAAPQVAAQVQDALLARVSLRAIANVVTVESASYEVLVERGVMASGWATETTAAETETSLIDRVIIPLHELSAMPKASQRLLDDAAFDIENWLAGRIAEKFARAEAAAFILGDGVNKPKGLLTTPTAPNTTATATEIGTVNSGLNGDFNATNPGGPLIDLVYALPAEFRANAHFVLNSRTASALRKLRDSDGRFLWSDSLAAGQPAQLLGYPVLICEDMPNMANSSKSIAFGDFRAAYTIVERPDLRVLRDPFSAKPHVLFYATKRVGGGVTDPRAVKLMNFA